MSKVCQQLSVAHDNNNWSWACWGWWNWWWQSSSQIVTINKPTPNFLLADRFDRCKTRIYNNNNNNNTITTTTTTTTFGFGQHCSHAPEKLHLTRGHVSAFTARESPRWKASFVNLYINWCAFSALSLLVGCQEEEGGIWRAKNLVPPSPLRQGQKKNSSGFIETRHRRHQGCEKWGGVFAYQDN